MLLLPLLYHVQCNERRRHLKHAHIRSKLHLSHVYATEQLRIKGLAQRFSGNSLPMLESELLTFIPAGEHLKH